MKGGLVGVWDGVFGAAEAFGAGGELAPFGALESEENFVEIAIAIFRAAKSGLDFCINGQGFEDVSNGFIEQGIGDREEAHEEHGGAFFAQASGDGKVFAEIGASERGTDEFGRLAGAHGDDSENGDPAAEFAFAEEGEGFTDTMDFRAQPEGGRIEIAEKAIKQRWLLFEERFDGGVIEFGSGDGAEELKLDEVVAGDVAGLDHRGFAEEVALEIAVAEVAGLVEIALRFHFFGQQGGAGKLLRDARAAVSVEQGEIDLEVAGEVDQRLQFVVAQEIVESEQITVLAKLSADTDDFIGGFHAFEDFDDDAVRRKQMRSAEAQSEFIHVDEGTRMAGERLQIV